MMGSAIQKLVILEKELFKTQLMKYLSLKKIPKSTKDAVSGLRPKRSRGAWWRMRSPKTAGAASVSPFPEGGMR